MTDLDRVAEILKTNRMAKEHEDYGFPRGWNEALEFVNREIGKLKAGPSICPHGFARPGYCSECNFD